MFKITSGKGFHMTFDNGYTVSVQFGAGNYGDNYDLSFDDPILPSRLAEFAAWGSDNEFLTIEGDEIHGYCTTKEVLRLINIVATLKETDQ